MSDKPLYGFDHDGASLTTTRRALLEWGFDPRSYRLTDLETGVRIESEDPEAVRAAHTSLSLGGRCSLLTLPDNWAPEVETAATRFEAAQRVIDNQVRYIIERPRPEVEPAAGQSYKGFDGVSTLDLLVIARGIAGDETGIHTRVREELDRRPQAEIDRAHEMKPYWNEYTETERFELTVTLSEDEAANLTMAASDLRISLPEVLALLAGRVQVEQAGRLKLSGEDES